MNVYNSSPKITDDMEERKYLFAQPDKLSASQKDVAERQHHIRAHPALRAPFVSITYFRLVLI